MTPPPSLSARPSLRELRGAAPFADRHIGTGLAERAKMLAHVGFASEEELIRAAVPAGITDTTPLDLPPAASEHEVLRELRELAARNRVLTSMIGLGYYGTVTPAVIRRNVLESPAWYTAYTPYQPEISQGRLEALLNFQTMVADLTGLPTANASLLDEGTAAAEAMALCRRASKSGSARFLVDAGCFRQTRAVVATRAEPLGIDAVVADLSGGLPEGDFFGVLVQYPAADGTVRDWAGLVEQAHARGALVAVAADLLALTLLRPPGEMGADVAVGTTQRFGVPMGFGGPHAAYMSVRSTLARSLPGRLVGVSVDADGRPAYRLALQTREQHIRREKATSNICTAQVLLAVMAAMYAVYHGPEGLRRIAYRTHRSAAVLAEGLRRLDGVRLTVDGASVTGASGTGSSGRGFVVAGFFDTVVASVPGRAARVVAEALDRGVNLWLVDADRVGVSCDETTGVGDVERVWAAFTAVVAPGAALPDVDEVDAVAADALPEALARTSPYLTHPVFHAHRSETAMMRYLRRLSDRDLALDRSMIPLGSCTMKLNAAVEMEPVTWPEFADLHPFAPPEQAAGTLALVADLEAWLAEITGYDAVSLQPNAGSQGELAGLLAVRAFHRAAGEERRTVCLIPSSAHGTNAASAVMAGMRVVVVGCRADGDVDLEDLRAKIAAHGDEVAVLMVTYPSTSGVFEQGIAEACALVHDAGGQVYVDGANLNALVGVARPGRFGADVSHLNLHKTFCIPHGGGGPGVGPVAVRSHLAPYLPASPRTMEALSGLEALGGEDVGGPTGPVASAGWGSAGILPISWAYVRLMGPEGLTQATRAAVLSANYVARRLAPSFPVLFTGASGLVAHECVVDLRGLTAETGVSVEDVAKRLVDYGFHAPTMSFPVAGTLMIEPTESEDLGEVERFCAAMVAIRGEIDRVAAGVWAVADSPLRQAPHTAAMVARTEWPHPYDRAEGAFPAGLRGHPGGDAERLLGGAPVGEGPAAKYWPPVRRIDGPFGDRNLVCSCPPVEAFASEGANA